MYIYDNISLNSSYNEKCFGDKRCRKSQNTAFIFKKVFKENHVVYEIMLKNTVEPDRPQVTIRNGAGKMGFERRVKKIRIPTYFFITD